ncbi:MAG: BamA/TamA family outer membrane protein [Bacteroidales bacterium]|nr:BamA/TamA family outer membrane protein [Bacteroidales bacterium]
MITNPRPALILLLLTLLLWGACNVTKNVPDGSYLLVKNKIEIDTKKISKDALAGYYQQEPNKKFLGLFRPGITFYNWGVKGKDSKFKKWLRTKIGSAPVILDTNSVSIGIKQMGLYLNNIGYFNSELSDTITYKKKKANVYYRIKTTKPYTIKSLKWSITDSVLASFVYLDTSNCKIKRNTNYNAYTLDAERTRITTALINHGFYRFNSTYIIFQVDSLLNSRQMDLTVEILNPVVPNLEDFGMVMESTHRRYKIHHIYVFPQFDYQRRDLQTFDTVERTYIAPYKGRRSITYYFLYRDKYKLRQQTIAQNILIEPDTWYNLTDINQTYSRLSGLQNFKYINIEFEDALLTDEEEESWPFQLDSQIKLARTSSQSLTWSTDGTNSAGALGVAGNIGYMNRNIFHGAQILKINLSASTQMQAGGGQGGLFNTIEFGASASITFPQFLIPIRQEKLPKSFKPKTTLTIGYNFQQKQDPDYNRHIANTSFGYTWVQNPTLSHTLNPIEVLLVKVFPSPEFTAKLDSLQDVRFKNQYTDHLIAGLKYTLTFSNQSVSKHRNFFYIRSNFETSGNLIYGIDKLFKAPKNAQDEYTLFGIQYSQFVRPDLDFRFYNQFGKGYSVVYRFYGGIGLSYGNSSVLPFEKAFLAGGANDMRGWRIGDLGPGSFHNDTISQNFGQLGDMQLQFQIEYRFPIYSFFKGALFTDIGNVWLLKPSPDLPGGEFHFDSFGWQIAMDVGIGIRLDFDFFIFRIDPAVRIRVPSMNSTDKWYFSKMQLKDIIWNFGIGYPF